MKNNQVMITTVPNCPAL